MNLLLAFIIGLWFGGGIVAVKCGTERIMENNEKEKKEKDIKDEISIDLIKIRSDFERVKPRRDKLKERIAYYEKTGEFYTPIVIDDENVLVDGYISYIIAKRYGKNKVEIIRR